jgi:iron complex outermembrane receptor protein
MPIRTSLRLAWLISSGLGIAFSAAPVVSAANEASTDQGIGLEEIVVTAQKREERMQDVPSPITAIGGQTLVDRDQLRVQDYYASVPGLNLTNNGEGQSAISIRGLTTGAGANPTVAIVVDDAPFGSTRSLAGSFAPDIDPGDLARVEVLRGPQGTLYGASSLGGLIKFVTVDPSPDALSGRVQADADNISHGNGVGYGVRGAINVPLSNTLAVRLSGFERRTSGYVDDSALHMNDVNPGRVDGGRLSALWRPSQNLSLKLSALVQNDVADGASVVTPRPGHGDLQQFQVLPLGSYHNAIRSYTATFTANFDGVNLVSSSAYSVNSYRSRSDASPFFADFIAEPLYGVGGAENYHSARTSKFTQEIRLAGSLRQWLDWLIGVFYTHEDSPAHDVYYAVNPLSLSVAGLIVDDPYPTTYAEYAAFADLTYHFTDRFDIQIGGRESQNRQGYSETLTGPLDGLLGLSSPAIEPPERTKDNSFTYLLTPRFKLSADLMVYARLASGYRPGGPNSTCILFPVPCKFAPDKTSSYELGVKGETPDRMVVFDASIYYIDWKNIQLQVTPSSGSLYYTNAGGAKSQGVELSVQARPLTGLTVSAWAALNDATLTADFPANSAAFGVSGDRLPYSSRFSANVSVEEDFPLADRATFFVEGAASYVGSRENEFPGSAQQSRVALPAYAQTNIRTGIRYHSWMLNLLVNNIADKRGALALFVLGSNQNIVLIQPRTVGLSVSKTF